MTSPPNGGSYLPPTPGEGPTSRPSRAAGCGTPGGAWPSPCRARPRGARRALVPGADVLVHFHEGVLDDVERVLGARREAIRHAIEPLPQELDELRERFLPARPELPGEAARVVGSLELDRHALYDDARR